WTTNAHHSDWFIALVRTAEAEDKHRGLSQLLVDLHGDGVSINPIPFLDGGHHFNEVVLDDVFVPADLLVAEEGQGGSASGSELSFERAAPERLLPSWRLDDEYARPHGGRTSGERSAALLGWAVSRYGGIRQLALSVARMIDDGRAPAIESAMVKEMATR